MISGGTAEEQIIISGKLHFTMCEILAGVRQTCGNLERGTADGGSPLQ